MSTRSARIDLEHDSDAPRTARRFLVRVLRGWGVSPKAIERSQLLVSELVSNAVLHGSGPVQVLARELATPPGGIRIEVCNSGHGRPRMRRAARDDLSGRGLQIVDELSGGWGSRNFDNETVVWFELRSSLA